MWILLSGVALVGLIWGLPALLGLMGVAMPLGWQLPASGAVIVAMGLAWLLSRWLAGARARALEQRILEQSDEQLRNVRPDRRAEVAELRTQIQHGIDALRASKLGGKGGRAALYTLPWYVVIGPPGAGKTTALQKSNLAFVGEQGGPLKGVGGTRNCDWWLSNEAILLDTAGRYATYEQDRGEWLAFLDLLRKYRKARPLNGVILAVSLKELLDGSSEDTTDLARKLRGRIDELTTRLEMVVPVYVMFSKADLVDGFIESFHDMSKNDRDQMLGATFPLEEIAGLDARQAFEREFARLVDQLHARAIRRLTAERSKEARAKILEFPIEFHVTHGRLAEFLEVLFMPNRFQGTPLFRGFYFTSGTQEGHPVSRAVAGMVEAFGLVDRLPPSVAPSDKKSYFVTDVFRRVIFPDQEIAARTDRETRRQMIVRSAFAVGCLLFALLVVAPASVTFARNAHLVTSTVAVVEEASGAGAGGAGDSAHGLGAVARVVSGLERWSAAGVPAGMAWGMYVGDTLLTGLRPAYGDILHQGIALPTRPEIESRLRAVSTEGSTPATYGRQYELLELYLMLGDREHLDVVWATPQLTRAWLRALPSTTRGASDTVMARHVRSYLELVTSGAARPWDLDQRLIESVRSSLRGVSDLERAYGILVRGANADVAPIRLESIFYGDAGRHLKGDKGMTVPGAYTRAGYEIVSATLERHESLLEAEAWVLGAPGGARPAGMSGGLRAKLEQTYLTRYRDAWRDLLGDVAVPTLRSYDDTLALLVVLTEPEVPYLRLIRELSRNTRLDGDASEWEAEGKQRVRSAVDRRLAAESPALSARVKRAAAGEQPASPLVEAFAPLLVFGAPGAGADPAKPPPGLAQYLGYLSDLVGAIVDAKRAGYADLTAVEAKRDAAVRGTRVLLESQTPFTRPLLQPLLLGPLAQPGGDGAEDSAKGSDGADG